MNNWSVILFELIAIIAVIFITAVIFSSNPNVSPESSTYHCNLNTTETGDYLFIAGHSGILQSPSGAVYKCQRST